MLVHFSCTVHVHVVDTIRQLSSQIFSSVPVLKVLEYSLTLGSIRYIDLYHRISKNWNSKRYFKKSAFEITNFCVARPRSILCIKTEAW